ncbi:MAG: HIT domain-containing protein [Candidatus Cloacimonetes bacterium]|nr:HIT domain-containing protein [Candidatus Cloacimonadota bacterium]
MKNLYSPWRIDYILQEKSDKCILCEKPKANDDESHLILKRGEYSYIIMNLYPYNNAHLMIVPFRHLAKLSELKEDELLEMARMVQLCEKVLTNVYHPEGFNIGMNLGEVAGAGVADHLHIHIVPRWAGDTNFISTIGKTRVIPEKMEEGYKKLKNELNKLNNAEEK